MTKELFREQGYLQECSGIVKDIVDGAIIFDQTVCYPLGGGQPGDTGELELSDGSVRKIMDTKMNRQTGEVQHCVDDADGLSKGEEVTIRVDWSRRYQIMRLHSCMHMLCSVVPAPVTGGSIREDGTARLDFDLPEPPDAAEIEQALNQLTMADHPMNISWISDEEMEAKPELVRTMSVKPPMGFGKVRLVEFEGIDLQPCGGTHVANTKEIGPVKIVSIKKKGKLNRRITIALTE